MIIKGDAGSGGSRIVGKLETYTLSISLLSTLIKKLLGYLTKGAQGGTCSEGYTIKILIKGSEYCNIMP